MQLRSRSKSVIVLFLGVILLGNGLYQIIFHYLKMRKSYTLVNATLISVDEVIHHRRYGKYVIYHPRFEFVYNGQTYNVKDPNGLTNVAMERFEKYAGDTVEVRVPVEDPCSAMLNYKPSLNREYIEGVKLTVIGIISIAVMIMIIF